MPSRARSDELPSSALYSTTSRPSKPPLALMMLIAWSAAAMPARPMLGPNDCGSAGSAAWGSSTPMRSTPSSRWVAGSALDDGVELAVAPSVVTALSGASAALGPPSPPEHAASVSAVAVTAAHRPNHWRRTPPTLGVEGNGDRATPITRSGAGRRAPSRAGSARPRRRARRDRRRRQRRRSSLVVVVVVVVGSSSSSPISSTISSSRPTYVTRSSSSAIERGDLGVVLGDLARAKAPDRRRRADHRARPLDERHRRLAATGSATA